jgi:hypothetical protein
MVRTTTCRIQVEIPVVATCGHSGFQIGKTKAGGQGRRIPLATIIRASRDASGQATFADIALARKRLAQFS